MLTCPVCGKRLRFIERSTLCESGHCFDIAKEGYVNLLRTTKNGDLIGDDKYSARCRRDFLNKGYYSILRDHLVQYFSDKNGCLLDICCGEGYYTSCLTHEGLSVYGFDISKEMVRLAAKRGRGCYFVANMAAVPVADASFDYAIHLFAPFHEMEFNRILKPGGSLLTVIPGKQHLFGLKKVLYDTPYVNDERLPDTQTLKLVSTVKLSKDVVLNDAADIDAVFRMTPYFFHTSQKDKDKLLNIHKLETPVEFVIAEYKKEGC